jgi:hypothetical protein
MAVTDAVTIGKYQQTASQLEDSSQTAAESYKATFSGREFNFS